MVATFFSTFFPFAVNLVEPGRKLLGVLRVRATALLAISDAWYTPHSLDGLSGVLEGSMGVGASLRPLCCLGNPAVARRLGKSPQRKLKPQCSGHAAPA